MKNKHTTFDIYIINTTNRPSKPARQSFPQDIAVSDRVGHLEMMLPVFRILSSLIATILLKRQRYQNRNKESILKLLQVWFKWNVKCNQQGHPILMLRTHRLLRIHGVVAIIVPSFLVNVADFVLDPAQQSVVDWREGTANKWQQSHAGTLKSSRIHAKTSSHLVYRQLNLITIVRENLCNTVLSYSRIQVNPSPIV